jgi:hypothetical protein
LVVAVAVLAGRKVAQMFLLMAMLAVNLVVKQVRALAERLTLLPQRLAERQLHHQLVVVAVALPRQLMALLAVLAHSLLVGAVVVDRPAQVS